MKPIMSNSARASHYLVLALLGCNCVGLVLCLVELQSQASRLASCEANLSEYAGTFAKISSGLPGEPSSSESDAEYVPREEFGKENAWSAIARDVRRSIFKIVVANDEGVLSSGTGFCIGERLIATNCHVIDGNGEAKSPFVFVCDSEKEILPLRGVIHQDSAKDIAILLLADETGDREQLPLLDANPAYGKGVVAGDSIAAIGHPLGFGYSLSTGHLSGVRRARELSKEIDGALSGIWLQHTAPISPGNSGGPLFDSFGRVVGMNTLHLVRKFGRAQNLNFAISSLDIAQARLEAASADFQPVPMPPKWLHFLVKSQL